MKNLPNILLLMSDQHRADALGCHGHPLVQTPNLDRLAVSACDFRRAYSASALCEPARRTLLSGQSPFHHGVLDSEAEVPLVGETLAGVLAANGMQTHIIGKLHVWPVTESFGFEGKERSDWIDPRVANDYAKFVRAAAGSQSWTHGEHNYGQNSRKVCAWALPEELHYTSWCSQRARSFLRTRDTRRPFFLQVSFIPPHPPLFPLPRLLEKYLRGQLHEPVCGDWAEPLSAPPQDGRPLFWRGRLDSAQMHKFRSAYYAAIEHVDEEIGNILSAIPDDTIVIYLSDHGDMLGDHFLFHKRSPYEASSRIPLLIRVPSAYAQTARFSETAVELMDVMPTLLDLLDIAIPESVDGISLRPLLCGHGVARRYIHGENKRLPPLQSGVQFITDGAWKYIWYPDRNWEQLFDLRNDPVEAFDLAGSPTCSDQLRLLRAEFAANLQNRDELRARFSDASRIGKIFS